MLCVLSTNLFAYSVGVSNKGNQFSQIYLPGTADTSSITRSYDAGNRVTQLANSRHSSMTVAGQPTQSYSYDDAGRLLRIDQAAGAINNNQAQNIQFVYDDAGRLTKTTYANGITRDNSYDDAGQLTGITYKKADNSLIGDLTYTYDANGRRTKTSGSLAKTDLPDTINTASYDANNRLTTWGSQILNYDKNGNLISDGLKTYIWNARNQLIQIKDSTGTEVASFSYDALGRRQNKTINGVSTGFMYDGVNIVQELSGASAINNYISAGVDQVFVQQSGAGASATSLTYLTDALGSTIRLTNATGDKVVDYSYDPYGNTKADAVINNAFQYTGRENDGNGLYYYRARYYSPTTHRFISEDPIGLNGGINTYVYVEGNPISYVDPLGLERFIFQSPAFGSLDNFMRIPEAPDTIDIIAHGNWHHITDQDKEMSFDRLIGIIKKVPNYKNKKVRMLVCSAGASSYKGIPVTPIAKRIHDALGVTVEAPNKSIWATPKGDFSIKGHKGGEIHGPSDPNDPGQMVRF